MTTKRNRFSGSGTVRKRTQLSGGGHKSNWRAEKVAGSGMAFSERLNDEADNPMILTTLTLASEFAEDRT